MVMSTGSIFSWLAPHDRRPERWRAATGPLGASETPVEAAAPDHGAAPTPEDEDEDEIDDLLPWFAPDPDHEDPDSANAWNDDEDVSLVPFFPDEDDSDGDADERP